MRFLQRTAPGVLGLNYMWLPTWVGMNSNLIKEIEEHVTPILAGQAITDELLDQADGLIINYLVQKFPYITGLFEYLDGLKYVETNGSAQEGQQRTSTSTPSSTVG